MKAAIVEKMGGPFVIWDISLDEPDDLEVLVDVKASGLCHSDLHVANDGYGRHFPVLLGHEVAGIVKKVGNKVTEFKAGDHVVASLIQFCSHCVACLSGRTHLCQNKSEVLRKEGAKPRISCNQKAVMIEQGYGIGGFAPQTLIHQNQLVKVTDDIPFSRACILGCGTITGAGAMINTAGVRPGYSVAVIGVGGVGLNAISGAKIAGATTIIAIDLQADKLAMAKKFGATHIINSATEDAVAKVQEITCGGVDAAFEVIGLKTTAEQALSMAKAGGGAYLVGLQKPGRKIEIEAMGQLIYAEKRLQGVWMGSTNLKRDIPTYALLYKEGRLNLDDLVSNEINIEQVQEAYESLAKGGVIARSVITSF